jgi:hypothetical protein
LIEILKTAVLSEKEELSAQLLLKKLIPFQAAKRIAGQEDSPGGIDELLEHTETVGVKGWLSWFHWRPWSINEPNAGRFQDEVSGALPADCLTIA